jgi:Tol biopolymer transport system component
VVRYRLLLLLLPSLILAAVGARSDGERLPKQIAFISDRPGGLGSFDIYLYDVRKQSVQSLPGANTPGMDAHPALYDGGKKLVINTERFDAKPRPGAIHLYNIRTHELTEPPGINGATTIGAPFVTADGKLIAASRFRNPSTPAGEGPPRDLLLYSVPEKRFITPAAAEDPEGKGLLLNISADGRWLVWNAGGLVKWGSLTLYDRREGRIVPDPGLDLQGDANFPSFSRDGRYLAFANRKDATADWDLKVFDRKERRYLDTPGLNSPGRDDFNSFSPGGRYLAIESNRSGNFDIYLYDLQEKRFIDLPGLNSPSKERHPSLCRD